jgi:uncharacterized membrane-anchored protein|tara:strand:- start:3800 stop:4006 length:207 start_codon:yes stop_codon:yes gene_type:complete
MKNLKSWYTSKTFWVAVSKLAVGTGMLFNSELDIPAYCLMAYGVVDVVIRFYTIKPINTPSLLSGFKK